MGPTSRLMSDCRFLEHDDFELDRDHRIRHCERSEAIQGQGKTARSTLYCFASLAMTELAILI
jgi:hypothetical protein